MWALQHTSVLTNSEPQHLAEPECWCYQVKMTNALYFDVTFNRRKFNILELILVLLFFNVSF